MSRKVNQDIFCKYIGQAKSEQLFTQLRLDNREEKKLFERVLFFVKVFQQNKGNILESIFNEIYSIDQVSSFTELDIEKGLYEKIEKLKEEKYQKEIYNDQSHATTNFYHCRKCKQNQCTFYEQQTRSADEPMTIFIKCCVCGFQWRQ
jgi:transcription elongation factor S-II